MGKGRDFKVATSSHRAGLTGREIAQKILDTKGIRDVRIERVPGRLSDHYDPRSKVLRLSPDIYNGKV